ncbi:cobalt-precorrin-6A reductase [Aureimonas pseudogalii]|uniref:Precorrin-6A/cobalt-precorrin-6A reductase n=1 Tax=Aureimonas pseudogalii TaxID=1744844 RepID=A0A7W6H732_9HYPH|nr:cobalt-precorrin-6A reductase [Aureimonas pseudogalii]MBB3999653.1 precorrin-6A/cobalt-precorrin-6A reductase [Aureimonas pseudogalii]
MTGEAILLLGGTSEATILAQRIARERPGDRLVVSLAGRTLAPDRGEGETRIGGFGGAAGLAAFLVTERMTRLVDATHPFAAGISRNAVAAATRVDIPLLTLLRPPWTRAPDEHWIEVACLKAACDALPAGARPFLALGRQHIAPFRHRPDLAPVLRMVDPPTEPLPFAAKLVIGRPGQSVEAEAALLCEHAVTHLVSRNSGGARSHAKIAAARLLGIPVVMIARPPEPAGPLARGVDEVMAWLAG